MLTRKIFSSVTRLTLLFAHGTNKLDYKQSERDNGIASLKKRYQGTTEPDGRYHEGASTLISRAKSETSIIKRRGSPTIDKETGELHWKQIEDPVYIDKKTGKQKTKTQPSTKMAETKASDGRSIDGTTGAILLRPALRSTARPLFTTSILLHMRMCCIGGTACLTRRM